MSTEAAVGAAKEEKLVLSNLRERIEEVLRDGDRERAGALIPELRILRKKVERLRSLGGDFAALSLSEYVLAVASLAGRSEEFARSV